MYVFVLNNALYSLHRIMCVYIVYVYVCVTGEFLMQKHLASLANSPTVVKQPVVTAAEGEAKA